MSTLQWSDRFLLGYPALDATHRDFVGCVAALQAADDAELDLALETLAAHLASHFGEEEAWMRDTAFPATQCHADEHTAVLRSVAEVRELVRAGGSAQVARDLAQALADWFPGHADYMDSALSHWLVKRTYGGAPVVLRRNDPAAATA